MAITYSAFPVQVAADAVNTSMRADGRPCAITETGWRAGNTIVWWDPHTFYQDRASGFRHEAADIMAPAGSRVVAARAGRVLETWTYNGEVRSGKGFNAQAGHYVRIQADAASGGGTDQYSHLLAPADVRPGERVEAGQTLGRVGESGSARGTCPHLHLGTRDASGRAVDMSDQLRVLFDRGGWRLQPTGVTIAVAIGLGVVGVAASTAAFMWWRKGRRT